MKVFGGEGRRWVCSLKNVELLGGLEAGSLSVYTLMEGAEADFGVIIAKPPPRALRAMLKTLT